jgi:hypothetical protein
MSEKKIMVDMNLFKVSNKTRKKQGSEKKDGIKVRTPSEKKKNETLKKRSILKMIRQHQEDRYKKLFDEKKDSKPVISADSNNFNKDFKEAQLYLQSLTDKNKHNNTTLRNNHPGTQSILFQPSMNPLQNSISEFASKVTNPTLQPAMMLQPAIQNMGLPKYGCLKGGELPTYRTLLNQTRKQPIISQQPTTPMHTIGGAPASKTVEDKINESLRRVNEMKETAVKLQQLKTNNRPKKMKRKRTVRRTYKIGKSKTVPKVSVLVSNKTIRNNISTQSQLLKQIPIEEVKRYLVKRGLIKIGTITPNDVLRKMYESTSMMCGDLQNHNPENLMYNFFNDK